MNTQKGSSLWLIIVLVALAVIAYFMFRSDRPETIVPPAGQPLGAQTQMVVLEGMVTCLPHRDTSGPVTMECAYGLKTKGGDYYGLDASNIPSEKQGGYDVGQQVSFEGVLVPQADIPQQMWSTYNIVGLMQVADYWVYRDK